MLVHCLCFFIITSAVKISALTHAINFFQFNGVKIFNAVNAGAELGLATPFINSSLLNKSINLFRYIFFYYYYCKRELNHRENSAL